MSPECSGVKVRARNREPVAGGIAELWKGLEDKDRFSHLLRYVLVDEVFANGQLVAKGYVDASSFGPERRFQQVFTELEQCSRLKSRGLWEACE